MLPRRTQTHKRAAPHVSQLIRYGEGDRIRGESAGLGVVGTEVEYRGVVCVGQLREGRVEVGVPGVGKEGYHVVGVRVELNNDDVVVLLGVRAHALRVAIILVGAARARVQLSRLDAEGVGLGGGVFTVVVIITGLGGGGAVEGLRRHRRRDSLGVENDSVRSYELQREVASCIYTHRSSGTVDVAVKDHVIYLEWVGRCAVARRVGGGYVVGWCVFGGLFGGGRLFGGGGGTAVAAGVDRVW